MDLKIVNKGIAILPMESRHSKTFKFKNFKCTKRNHTSSINLSILYKLG